MSSPTHSREDAAFERLLLDAEQGQEEVTEVDQAWARLSTRLRCVAAQVEPGSGVHPLGSEGEPLSPETGSQLSPAAAGGTVRWLTIGAAGGSLITAGAVALWQAIAAPPSERATAASATTAHLLQSAAPQAVPVAEVEVPAAEATASALSEGALQATEAAREQSTSSTSRVFSGPQVKASLPRRVPPVHKKSTLAEEVGALDAARRASAKGDYELTLERVRDFHRAFPRSVLAPDAEVLALDALRRLQRDSSQRRRRFLRQYPQDPHADRIRQQ